MTAFRGLTWDHPRGRTALQAAAVRFSADGPDSLTWDVQPLEGFESAPIEELATRFDLVVLDHPHLGDALRADCLTPLEELFTAEELAGWARDAVGPSAASYVLDRRTWALPLDAATQVSARRPDLLAEPPATWEDALAQAGRGGVAPSLAGPHALLSLFSIAVSQGAAPGSSPDVLLPRDAGLEALEVLAALARHAPVATLELNPIGLLARVSTADDLVYVPLVYGYSTYSAAGLPRTLAFGAPPASDGRIGSTIGGTGIAVSRRTPPTPALLDHLRWLMSEEAQRRFIPQHEGQPSLRSAWADPEVDSPAGGFYSGTLDTIEQSWVRPRFAGYIPFQSAASAVVRDGLASGADPNHTLDTVDQLYRAALAAAASPAPVPASASASGRIAP